MLRAESRGENGERRLLIAAGSGGPSVGPCEGEDNSVPSVCCGVASGGTPTRRTLDHKLDLHAPMTIVALADVYQHVSPRPQPLTRFTLAPHIPDAGMRRGVYPLQSGTAPRGDPGPSSSAYRQQQQHQGASSSPFPTSGSRVTSQNASRTVPLPPIMSDGDQTSLLRLPIGKDTIVEAKSWTYKISPDHSTDTQAAQAHILALRRLSLAEGRLFAWSARKRRTDRTDAGQDGLSSCYDSTLYCTSILSKDEARALDETASSNAAVLGKRKDFEASNENGRAGASAFVAGEQGVACLMVRTFRLRSERQDPTPGDKTSGVEEHVKAASTPSPLNNSKGSPEDDLWGEGDDASARGNNEAERESALREEVSACRQSLDEVMQRNEKDSELLVPAKLLYRPTEPQPFSDHAFQARRSVVVQPSTCSSYLSPS